MLCSSLFSPRASRSLSVKVVVVNVVVSLVVDVLVVLVLVRYDYRSVVMIVFQIRTSTILQIKSTVQMAHLISVATFNVPRTFRTCKNNLSERLRKLTHSVSACYF